mmetsp:Transcript_12504/g.21344  ORF Transcript_12504/g.21344 Transcript_12504/m.21344 type:complete len:153 (-) Transcript_12504:46-504(-)
MATNLSIAEQLKQMKDDVTAGQTLSLLGGEVGEFYQDHRRYTGGVFASTSGEERWHKLTINNITSKLEKKEEDGAMYKITVHGHWTCHTKGYKGVKDEFNSRNYDSDVDITFTLLVSRDMVVIRDKSFSRNDWGEISICFDKIIKKHGIAML